MEKLKELVLKLKEIRGVPQFLFAESIQPQNVLKVRNDVLKFKKGNPDANEIDFIIDSPGGLPGDAYRVIRTLRNNFEKVNIIIPFWAKSAATLISLGGSTIIMDEFGEMGPPGCSNWKRKRRGGHKIGKRS